MSAHFMPRKDFVNHESDDDCVCGPTPVLDEDQFVMLHHSLDGREMREEVKGDEGTIKHYHNLRAMSPLRLAVGRLWWDLKRIIRGS